MKRFREGLVFKAHRFLYHSTPGSRVIKKKSKKKFARSFACIRRALFALFRHGKNESVPKIDGSAPGLSTSGVVLSQLSVLLVSVRAGTRLLK